MKREIIVILLISTFAFYGCGIKIAGRYYSEDTDSLHLRYPELTEVPDNLEQLPGLKEFRLSYSQITKVEKLNDLTNLQELYLNNNRIEKIENISRLGKLNILDISYNRIEALENLSKISNLKALYIENDPINSIGSNTYAFLLTNEVKIYINSTDWFVVDEYVEKYGFDVVEEPEEILDDEDVIYVTEAALNNEIETNETLTNDGITNNE